MANIYNFVMLCLVQDEVNHAGDIVLDQMIDSVVPILFEMGILGGVLGAPVIPYPHIISCSCQSIRQTRPTK